MTGLSALLAGCGSADNPSTGAKSGGGKSKRHLTAKPGDDGLAEMVAAFTTAKGPPIEMKFMLANRPEVGQPVDVDVAIVAHSPVPESLSAVFTAAEGLEVVGGSDLPTVEKPVEGAPIRHVVSILPKRDGIFAITALVSFKSANTDATRTFAIPVISGQGLPEQVAKGP